MIARGVAPLNAEGAAPRCDAAINAAASIIFSISLGMLSVAVPLLALHSGYGAALVGVLVALSATVQLVTRAFMGVMMRHAPDKLFIILAAVLIAASCGLLVVSQSLAGFVGSLAMQGMARAFFFTASYTHAVRISPSSVRAITAVNLASGIGGFIGPALAGGLIELSGHVTLAVGMAIGLTGVVPGLLLRRLSPLRGAPQSRVDRIQRQPGVRAGVWMASVAGAWKGVLDSFVPIVLSMASQSAATIGLLVAVANAALFVGTGLSVIVRRAGIRGALMIGIGGAAVGIACLGPLAPFTLGAAIALACSGLGAGALQTVGPAVAAESVGAEQKGDAITLVGLARAATLLMAPLGMAGLVILVPVMAACVITGSIMALPMLARLERRAPGGG